MLSFFSIITEETPLDYRIFCRRGAQCVKMIFQFPGIIFIFDEVTPLDYLQRRGTQCVKTILKVVALCGDIFFQQSGATWIRFNYRALNVNTLSNSE